MFVLDGEIGEPFVSRDGVLSSPETVELSSAVAAFDETNETVDFLEDIQGDQKVPHPSLDI